MVAVDTSPENVRSGDNVPLEQIPHYEDHRDHGSTHQQTTASGDEPAVAIDGQTEAADSDDGLFKEWRSLTWWQKPIQFVKLTARYMVALFLYGLLMVLGSSSLEDKERAEWQRRKQNQQMLQPGTASNAAQFQLPQAPDSAASSSGSATDLESICSRLLRRVCGVLLRYSPQIAYALMALLMVKLGAPPRQDQQMCLARQTADSFTGNSDIYGLGIRLGIYVQWVCVTFTMKFLPSARRYVVSAYLLYQVGMVVAMCLLFSPGTCTFTAEVWIVLQFLWGGSAIAFVPSIKRNTRYDPKSKYLGIEMTTAVLGILTFIFTSWLFFRLFFRGEYDFTATPGDGTYTFWMGPVNASNMVWIGRTQLIWAVMKAGELFEIFCDQSRDVQFSSFLDWNWWFSVAMTTGSLGNILQQLVLFGLYFAQANQRVIGGFMGEPSDGEP